MSDLQIENKPAVYVIRKGRPAGFKFTLTIADKVEIVNFESNRYECPSKEHEKQIDKLLKKPQFKQNIMKVDLLAGAEVAKAHQKQLTAAAVKGGMTTETLRNLEHAGGSAGGLQTRGEIQDDALKALKDDASLVLTQDAVLNAPVVATPIANPTIPATMPKLKLGGNS